MGDRKKCAIIDVKPDFQRVVHPKTGRFLFELDAKRMIVVVVDRGQEAVIDLARLIEQAQVDNEGA